MKVIVPLSSTQRQFMYYILDDFTRYVGFGGARGGGKTMVSCMAMVIRRIKYPGTLGLFLRLTESAAQQNLRKEIEKACELLGLPPGSVKYNKNEKMFYFPNGSQIRLGYCDNPEHWKQYHGIQYTDICFEEGQQFPVEAWQQLKGSNRTEYSGNLRCVPKMWATCMPGGPGWGWIDELLRKGGEDRSKWITSKAVDCPANIERNPDYLKKLMSMPEPLRSWWLEGNGDYIAGAYFQIPEEIQTDVNIPYYAEWFAGVDWGGTSPFAVIYGAKWTDATGDRIHIAGEIYRAGLNLDEQAEQVHEMEEYLHSSMGMNSEYVKYYADPSVAKKTETVSTEIGRSIKRIWALHDFYVSPAKSNARVPGWSLMKYLMNNRVITISPNCHMLLKEMKSAQFEGGETPTSEDLDKRSALGSHALDAMRYLVVSVFGLSYEKPMNAWEKQDNPDGYNEIQRFQKLEIR